MYADNATVNPSSVILIDPSDAGNTGFTGTPLVIANVGTYTVNAAGTVVFTPLENFNGPANIKYTIKDNDAIPLVSNQAILNISVTAVNDEPDLLPDSQTFNEDEGPLNINAANGLLSNDNDVDGNPLNVTQFSINNVITTVDPSSGGTTTINDVGDITINRDGSYTFTPVQHYNGSCTTNYLYSF